MFCRTNFWTSAGCSSLPSRESRPPRATDEDFADLQRILDAQQRKAKKKRSIGHCRRHRISRRPGASTRNRVVVSLMATLNDLLVESRKLTLKAEGPSSEIRGRTRSSGCGDAPPRH